MVQLYDKETGAALGSISDEQFRFLMDQLEEESPHDQDYHINAVTLDYFQENGADESLLRILRSALGAREEMEIRWAPESSGMNVTIYVSLLDEGTDMWRPVSAEHVRNNIYRITGGPPDDTEGWPQFAPGDTVRCRHQTLNGCLCLVAYKKQPNPDRTFGSICLDWLLNLCAFLMAASASGSIEEYQTKGFKGWLRTIAISILGIIVVAAIVAGIVILVASYTSPK